MSICPGQRPRPSFGHPPASAEVSCDGFDAVADLTTTSTAGQSTLQYDASKDEYVYVWKTDDSWAGTCRALLLEFVDGSTETVVFEFR